jgi:RNA polymerase sigma-70 factor, ECF subfamily
MRRMPKIVEATTHEWQAVAARLRRYLRNRVDPNTVDDLLGDILLRLVNHQETLRSAENPSAWVYRVAANTVADHYRRRAAENRVLTSRSGDQAPDMPAPSLTEISPAAELANCLDPLIRSLPATYAQALQLTDIAGVSQVDAAKQLGLSTSGMKSRVQRGRARLKETLLRCCQVHLDKNGGIVDYEPNSGTCC